MRSQDETFRTVIRKIPTPVAVLTTCDASGNVHGMTIGSLAFVSRQPQLLQFCLARKSRVHDGFLGAARLAISLLSADQAAVAAQFAGPVEHRFRGSWVRRYGLPVVAGAWTYLLCEVTNRVPAGDHTLFIVNVVKASPSKTTRTPLIYWNGTYASVGSV